MVVAKMIAPETVPDGRVSRGGSPPQEARTAIPLIGAQTAHDLANFLTGIRMLIQSLSDVSPADHAVQEHIASLKDAGSRASELCGQLQNTFSGQSDDLETEVCEVDIAAMINEMRHLLELSVRSDAELSVEVDIGIPHVIADPTSLRRLLLALVTNGSDALGTEGGSITIRSGISNCDEGPDTGHAVAGDRIDAADCIYLEVSDTGCGIAEDRLQRIFEPSYTTKKDGHGLGLASVLYIVHGCGGAVTVDSRVGLGTRVRCLFPAATPQPELPGVASSNSAEKTVHVRNTNEHTSPITILLIEDVPALRHLAKSLLENSDKLKATVFPAKDGKEAMAIFRRQRSAISLVILDMNLPDCRGTQLIRDLRELSPEVPVMLASATPEQELISQCEGCVPDAIVVKPYDSDALIRQIHNVLGSSSAETFQCEDRPVSNERSSK